MATTDVSSQSSGDAHTETFDRDILSRGTLSSADDSAMEFDTPPFSTKPGPRIDLELAGLFTENVAAKIWRVAVALLEQEVSSAGVSCCCNCQKLTQVTYIYRLVLILLFRIPRTTIRSTFQRLEKLLGSIRLNQRCSGPADSSLEACMLY